MKKHLINFVILLFGALAIIAFLGQMQSKASRYFFRNQGIETINNIIEQLDSNANKGEYLTEIFHTSNAQTIKDMASVLTMNSSEFEGKDLKECISLFQKIQYEANVENLAVVDSTGKVIICYDEQYIGQTLDEVGLIEAYKYDTMFNLDYRSEGKQFLKASDAYGDYYIYCTRLEGSDYYLVMTVDKSVLNIQYDAIKNIENLLSNVTIGNDGILFAVDIQTDDFIYFDDGEKELTDQNALQMGLSETIYDDSYDGIQEIDGDYYYCVSKTYKNYSIIVASKNINEIYSENSKVILSESFIFILFGLFVIIYAGILSKDFLNDKQAIRRKKIGTFNHKELYYNISMGKRLVPTILISTLVVFGVSFYIQSLYNLSDAIDLSSTTLENLDNQINIADEDQSFVQDYYENHYLAKAKLISYMLENDPTALNTETNCFYSSYDKNGTRYYLEDDEGNQLRSSKNDETLAKICDNNGISSIYVFDEQGRTIATNTENWYFTISRNEEDQSYAFLDVLDGKKESYIQSAQIDEMGINSQYIGVSFDYYTTVDDQGNTVYVCQNDYLNDKTGTIHIHHSMIQIELNTDRMLELYSFTDLESILSSLNVSSEGFVIAFDNSDDHNVVYSPLEEYYDHTAKEIGVSDKAFSGIYNGFQRMDGINYLQTYRVYDDYYIATSIPTSQIYEGRWTISFFTSLVSLLFFMLIYGMLTINTKGEIERYIQKENTGISTLFEIKMPSGSMKLSNSLETRWDSVIRWKGMTPEKKLLFIIRCFVFGLVILLCIRMSEIGNMLNVSTIEKFIYSGAWDHSFNIFALSACGIVIVITFLSVTVINSIITVVASVLDTKTETVAHLIVSLIKYGGTFASIYYSLYLLGLDSTSLLTSAGILSIVIGLGAQSMIGDIIAGIFIVFEGEFQVGDIVTIGDFRGQVLDIGLRTTKIEDSERNIKIFNNSEVSGIINMTKNLSLLDCYVSISYEVSIEEVEAILNKEFPEIKKRLPAIVEGPKYRGVSEIGESGVILDITVYCQEADLPQLKRDLNREIILLFNRNGLEIPYNQLVVTMNHHQN